MIFPWGNSPLLLVSYLLLSASLEQIIFMLFLLCIGFHTVPPIHFSPGNMQVFSVFKSTLVGLLYYCDLIYHSRNKFSCSTTVKNDMDYFKLNVIKPTKVLGSKPKREKWCKYSPTIMLLRQPGKYVIKINDSNVY